MKKTSGIWAVAVAGVATMLAAWPAQAGLGSLGELLRSPVGRYLMFETAEGIQLAERIAGARGSMTSEELLSKLASREMAKVTPEIETRLEKARSRFRYRVGTAQSATELLESIAREELASRLGASGGIEFMPSASAKSFVNEREAFLKSEESKSVLAGRDLSGRKLDPGAKLSGGDLRFANLAEIEAPHANLEEALLERVDLSLARMPGSDFRAADLTHARLTRAWLKDASFRNAELRDADLRGAHLNGADFSGADLRGADLTGAHVEPTYFRQELEVKAKGAFFDSRTKLPFSREQALGLGMIFVQ